MITVRLDAPHCRLTLQGHAGSGPYGNDAVCAAASILAYTLAQGLWELKLEGRVTHCTWVLESGNAQLRCRENIPEAVALFENAARGFRLLAATCPTQVTLM